MHHGDNGRIDRSVFQPKNQRCCSTAVARVGDIRDTQSPVVPMGAGNPGCGIGATLPGIGIDNETSMWDCLAWVSGAVWLLLTLSLLPPLPWRKAPTPKADGAKKTRPEGVPLQAPDGFSYADTHPWVPDDQKALVKELALASVRKRRNS